MNLQSKKWLWTGRILSVLGGGFMLFDVVIHIMRPPEVVQGFAQMGYSLDVIVPLAIVEFICLLFYAIPKTSVFGAILLTGYLGGAVDANVRVGNALFGFVLFPVYVAIVLWIGLYLRDARLRELVPFNK
jgi:chaperone required for assembly of F1-ATPase